MAAVTPLVHRLRMLREARTPPLSRKALGEAVGYLGDSAYQTVYEWETGRRGLPAELMPDLAATLGVSICALYGRDEGHQAVVAVTLAEQLAQVMGVEPGRVEVNVYPKDTQDSRASGRLSALRSAIRRWSDWDEETQADLLAAADEIRARQADQERTRD